MHSFITYDDHISRFVYNKLNGKTFISTESFENIHQEILD